MPKKKPKTKAVTVGRPTVFTDLVLQKLEEAFAMDCTVREACAYAGIGESTYYEEAKANDRFREKMERSMEFPFFLAKKTVLQALKENDGNLALKWLKNRQRGRYHEKVEQEVKQTTVEELVAEVGQNAEYAERFETK